MRRWRGAHRRILLYEAWGYHGTRLRAGAPYGPVFRDAISAGARVSASVYAQALNVRRRCADAMAAVFKTVDVVLTPTCPTVAPAVEEGRRRAGYTRYTTLAAFAGLPAISIPAGTGYLGLPIGVQLIAPAHQERALVATASLLEELLAVR